MSKLVFAPDGLSYEKALDLGRQIGDRVYATKIHDLYDRYGPKVVQAFLEAGVLKVWVDAKLKDIPRTVRDRAAALADAGASIITVHTDGEIEMMMAAVEGAPNVEIYGVTVLTSLSEESVHLLTGHAVKAAVLYRARLAKLAGLHGIVCSPQEVGFLSKRPELKGLKFVVPGTRSPGKEAGDQKRVTTPAEAVSAGATYLVVASQVSKAEDPIAELDQIEKEIAA